MEFPSLGKNCEKSDCNRLDFLPIKCNFCSEYFCSEHSPPDHHSCAHLTAAGHTEKADGAIQIQRYHCSVPGCKKTELAPVLCNYCALQICLGHRHQADHHCEKLEPGVRGMTETRALVDNILSSHNQPPASDVPKKPRSVKAQKTAAKVQLMKLKMKSSGDKTLPQAERIYFLVTPPKSSGKSVSGAWVSRRWVMGRVIDSLAASLGVQNNNNLQSADKLNLFRSADGESVSEDTSLELEKVLNRELLFNGDAVTLEYVVQ